MQAWRAPLPRLSLFKSDDGVTAVTVAVSLLVLMGLAAIAIDGSNLYRERGDVQNAADTAALAAAYEYCLSGDVSTAVQAGEDQAAANDYVHDPTGEVQVTITQNPEGEGNDIWVADIETTIGGFFSVILGADSLTTAATAKAQCTPGSASVPAFFAGGQCVPEKNFKISGNTDSWDGLVHSNGDGLISGNGMTFGGGATYVIPDWDDSGSSGTIYASGPSQVGYVEWPVKHTALPGGLSLEDFDPVTGSLSSRSDYNYIPGAKFDITDPNLESGIYVTDNEISVGVDGLTGSYTFVILDGEGAGGIEFSGNQPNVTAYLEGILMVVMTSNSGESDRFAYEEGSSPAPNCDYRGVSIPGSGDSTNLGSFDGLIFAPRSKVVIGGNFNVFRGGVVAYTIEYSGNNNQFFGGSTGGTGGPRSVLLE